MTPEARERLERLTRGAGAAVPLSERVAGAFGRGGPRWHRWRQYRLRLLAARVEAWWPAAARRLRAEAAQHLAQAVAPIPAAHPAEDALLALLRGQDPLEGVEC